MICPRCGAYNSNAAEQCEACSAPFDLEARREGMAVEEETGLAKDPWAGPRWTWPTDLRLASGLFGSALVLTFGLWFLLASPAYAGVGLLLIMASLIAFLILGASAVGTGIYNRFQK